MVKYTQFSAVSATLLKTDLFVTAIRKEQAMRLLQECKFYFSSWAIVIAGFVLITIYFGWKGFLGLWLGLGIITLIHDRHRVVCREDPPMLVIIGPFGFTTMLSDRFD